MTGFWLIAGSHAITTLPILAFYAFIFWPRKECR